MFNFLISLSLKNRLLVVVLAALTMAAGGYLLSRSPVDVFPELDRPTVTIMTEVPGRAPEEIEQLVTFPIEAAMNGAPGVERVRSVSAIGLSIVWVEFGWGTDVNVDQQMVTQRLGVATVPQGVRPVIMPISSLMGEIMLISLDYRAGPRQRPEVDMMELRTLADWTIRPRLMAIGGVAQVRVIGGVVKQFQVQTDPPRLALYDVTLEELKNAVGKANVATGGGFIQEAGKESLIRITGRSFSLEELGNTVVAWKSGVPIRVRQVADVVYGGPVKRGDSAVQFKLSKPDGGHIEGGPAVVLDIDKQVGANTLELDGKVHEVLDQLREELRLTHPDVRIDTNVFKQSDFIRSAIDNVVEAVRDGVILLAVILFLFLWNFRTALVTLLVLPLPLAILGLLFSYFNIPLNTMTLGGIAIAIGDLVDDSIVDIENIYRRLKENRQRPDPQPALKVVFDASSEVRNSIVYATLIVCLVVFPLFFLSGLEGRMFTPMGIAYIVTLLASLLVSLTITPVLASYLLPTARFMERQRDPFLVRGLKAVARPCIRLTLRHPWTALGTAAVLVVLSLLTLPFMGGEFLPAFNEGTLTINLLASPGTSLAESNRLATLAEQTILEVPEVLSTGRRTGRAELDEHAENVNSTDLEVHLQESRVQRPGWVFRFLRHVPLFNQLASQSLGRPREEVVADIRDRLAVFPGVEVNIGQPISHRLDHIMSGVRAEVAVKVFGPDLHTLRSIAADIEQACKDIPGVVDLSVEPLEEIDQVRIEVRHDEAARYGRSPAEVAELLETALGGRVVSQVIDGQQSFDVVVWFTESARNDLETIRSTLVDTPRGRVPLRQLADVRPAGGPVSINRENLQRRIAVTSNVAGRDLTSAVEDMRSAIAENVDMPGGYYVEFGGQFEARRQASVRLWLLLPAVFLGIFMLLCRAVESWRAALQILVNIPLAFLGAVIALLIANRPSTEALSEASWLEWPGLWIEASSLSLAHWVGFITLTGIVTRNGIMMISHYIHLMRYEGEKFDEHMIVRGTLERLTPVLMTAVTSIIGLLPLLLGAGETGKEILYPLALVVTGGMISSTLLDQLVTPALFYKFGRKAFVAAAEAES